jgi:hypothetical protein
MEGSTMTGQEAKALKAISPAQELHQLSAEMHKRATNEIERLHGELAMWQQVSRAAHSAVQVFNEPQADTIGGYETAEARSY